jgi:Helix-turn-helix domain
MQSVISRAEQPAVKAFSPAQEAALRGLILDTLIDSGYAPRSTKPQRTARTRPAELAAPQPLHATHTGPLWPDDDDVLLSATRVMRGLGVGRTKLFELIDAGQLKPVRGVGRKLKFRREDVFALIARLAEAA